MAPLTADAVSPLVPTYHWYDSCAPVAATVSTAEPPVAIVCDCGCAVMTGGSQATVTVAALLSTLPQALLTRTQYAVVCAGETSRVAEAASGAPVSPGWPAYHWSGFAIGASGGGRFFWPRSR